MTTNWKTKLPPHRSRRDLRLAGTQPFNMAGHLAVAGPPRKTVEALGRGRRYWRFAGTVASASAEVRRSSGPGFPIIAIQEAGLDGFWIHRVLESEGIESHVVDAASILTSRRRRQAKTDRIDGETLVRTLLAYKRGEPRVCSMVRPPSLEEEDRRRLCRERKTLLAERIKHTNRIKGLLCAQGIFDYDPLLRNRRSRLDDLNTGDRRPLPPQLKAQISRELDRIELLMDQLKIVEAERDGSLAPASEAAQTPAVMLAQLKGIGSQIATMLWSEALYRHFDNRRQVAGLCGPSANTVEKRLNRPRAGCLQSRQSALEGDDDPGRLALDAAPACVGVEPVVL